MIKEALVVTYHPAGPILGHPSQLLPSSFELVSSTKEAAVCELYLAPHFQLFLFSLFSYIFYFFYGYNCLHFPLMSAVLSYIGVFTIPLPPLNTS